MLVSLMRFVVYRSPSSRRAWIEILGYPPFSCTDVVALLAEGVDRNLSNLWEMAKSVGSPSSRRAWIEISG